MSTNESLLRDILQESRNTNSTVKDLAKRVADLEGSSNDAVPKLIKLVPSGNKSNIILTKVFTSANQPDPGPSTSGLNVPGSSGSRKSFPSVGESSRAVVHEDQPDHLISENNFQQF